MRIIIAACIALATVAVGALSAAMNASFLSAFGRNGTEAYMLGGAAIALDVIKCLIPAATWLVWTNTPSWRARIGFTVIAVPVFIAVLSFSLASALGFFGTLRTVSVDRSTVNAQLALAERESTEITTRFTGLPKQPSAAIAAEIEALKLNRRWTSTKGCIDATAAASRSYCATVQQAKARLAQSVAAERGRAKLANLRKEIKQLRAAGAGTESDPQAALMARIARQAVAGVTTADARAGMIIGFSALVEIVASFGLSLGVAILGKPVLSNISKPVNLNDNATTEDDRKPVNRVTVIPPRQLPPPSDGIEFTPDELAAMENLRHA